MSAFYGFFRRVSRKSFKFWPNLSLGLKSRPVFFVVRPKFSTFSSDYANFDPNSQSIVRKPQPKTIRTNNYVYTEAYNLVQVLRDRPITYVRPRTLSEVPLACCNFNAEHSFPDDQSLKNWVTSMDVHIGDNRMGGINLSKALLGLAKINVCTDGVVTYKIGWPKLAQWFHIVLDACPTVGKNPFIFDKLVQASSLALYRFAGHSHLSVKDYEPIGRRVIDHYPEYSKICPGHIVYRKNFVNTLWCIEIGLDLRLDDYLGQAVKREFTPFLVSHLAELDKYAEKQFYLVTRLRLAKILLLWEYDDIELWRQWLKTTAEHCERHENFSVQFTAHALKTFMRILCHFNMKPEFDRYKKFWREKMALYVNFLRPQDVERLKLDIESESCRIFSDENEKKEILNLVTSCRS